jgi:hypothetical protein
MRQLIWVLIFILPTSIFAQGPFTVTGLDEALHAASDQGKMVFVQFESGACRQCNEVADKAFADPALSASMKQAFICLKIDPAHPDREKFSERYNMPASAGTVFLNSDGTLVRKFMKTTSSPAAYRNEINEVLQRAGETMNLNALEKEFNAGNHAPGFLELLMQKRSELNLPTDSLLDLYVSSLPDDSVSAVRTLRFIATMAPGLDSKANAILRSQAPLFAKAWYSLPLQQRMNLNGKIIFKSMKRAVATKNEAYANFVASFAKSTYPGQEAAGKRAFEKNMLYYYKGVVDTSKYFLGAISYYEQYYMSLDADSIRRNDSLRVQAMLKTAPKKDSVISPGVVRSTARISYLPQSQYYANELSEGAASINELTSNPYLLEMAAEWSKKALSFVETQQALETAAKINYHLKRNGEAESLMLRLIDLKKRTGYPVKDEEELLKKMRKS